MKKLMLRILLALFIAALLHSPSFAELMSAESFQALTPYGVPELADSGTVLHKKPAIWTGICSGGSVTYASWTYQTSFASGCVPVIFLTVRKNEDTSTTGYEVHVKTSTNAAFTYEVRQNANGTVTDVTALEEVYWVAIGWK